MRICKVLGLSSADSARWNGISAIRDVWRILRPKRKQLWIDKGGSMGPISHKLGVRDRLMTVSPDPTSDKRCGSRFSVSKVGALSCNELRQKPGPILYAFMGVVCWVRAFGVPFGCALDPR